MYLNIRRKFTFFKAFEEWWHIINYYWSSHSIHTWKYEALTFVYSPRKIRLQIPCTDRVTQLVNSNYITFLMCSRFLTGSETSENYWLNKENFPGI